MSPKPPLKALLKLPEDAGRRIARRLETVAPELFLLLDDVREHGGKYLIISLARPGSEEKIRLVLAEDSVRITDSVL